MPNRGHEDSTKPAFDTPLTPKEADLVDHLIEECAEIIYHASKLKRFGRRPTDGAITYDNVHDMSMEIGNMRHVVELLFDLELVHMGSVRQGEMAKREKLPRYQRTLGNG